MGSKREALRIIVGGRAPGGGMDDCLNWNLRGDCWGVDAAVWVGDARGERESTGSTGSWRCALG